MINMTHEEFTKSVANEGFEVYSKEEFDEFLENNMETLQKGESGELEDFEKSEYDTLKEEIRSFTPIKVVSPSQHSRFRTESTVYYTRDKQVEWNEPELVKGEDGEDIEKARSGRYTNTALNRKLGRVGQEYGSKKVGETDISLEESRKKQLKELIKKTTDEKAKFELKQALAKQNDTLESEPHIRAYKKRIKELGDVPWESTSFGSLKEGGYGLTFNTKDGKKSVKVDGKDIEKLNSGTPEEKQAIKKKYYEQSSKSKESDKSGINIGDTVPLGKQSDGKMAYGKVESKSGDKFKVKMDGGGTVNLTEKDLKNSAKETSEDKPSEKKEDIFKIGQKYDTDSGMGGKLSYKFTGEKGGKLQFKNTMHKDYGGGNILSLTREQAEKRFK